MTVSQSTRPETRPNSAQAPEINHESRKADHIRINLEENVSFNQLTTGLEDYFFMHEALPELDLAEIDTTLSLFNKELTTPLLISSMTGGTAEARDINRVLAEAAQEAGLAMGLGSMRAAIEDSHLDSTYQVRDVAPDILLFANLGAVQFNYGYGIDECQRAPHTSFDVAALPFGHPQPRPPPAADPDSGRVNLPSHIRGADVSIASRGASCGEDARGSLLSRATH